MDHGRRCSNRPICARLFWEYDMLLEVIISGISAGALYAVIGIGLSLVYGVSGVFNFAYGSFFIWGGYLTWLVLRVAQLNYLAVFILVVPAIFFMGMLAEWISTRPLRNKPNFDITTMMTTLGLAIFLDNLIMITFGPYRKSIPPLFDGTLNIANLVVGTNDLAVFLIALAVIFLFEMFLAKTRIGMAIRATGQDMVGAKVVGIRINRVFSYTFGLSAVMVAVGAILIAPKLVLYPLGGWDILVKAFVIITLGGLGSIRGTLYAAFILGLTEALVGLYVGLMWTIISWFIILLIILVIRPKGLLGIWS